MEGVKIDLDVQEIYNLCCPECQKKLASAVASKMATNAIAKELEKQWKKQGKEAQE